MQESNQYRLLTERRFGPVKYAILPQHLPVVPVALRGLALRGAWR